MVPARCLRWRHTRYGQCLLDVLTLLDPFCKNRPAGPHQNEDAFCTRGATANVVDRGTSTRSQRIVTHARARPAPASNTFHTARDWSFRAPKEREREGREIKTLLERRRSPSPFSWRKNSQPSKLSTMMQAHTTTPQRSPGTRDRLVSTRSTVTVSNTSSCAMAVA